jgi:hypothetical protein
MILHQFRIQALTCASPALQSRSGLCQYPGIVLSYLDEKDSLMKGTVFHGPHDVRVERVEDPALKTPTDALVRITRAGICGSDLHC